MPKSQLLLLTCMPRSGSTWILRMLNELWVAGGAQDYTDTRSQFKLDKYMTYGSALVSMSLRRLLPLMRPLMAGKSFVVKTHECPNTQSLGFVANMLLRRLTAMHRLVTIYLYRDPRDAVLSGYEYGRRSVEIGKPNAFVETFRSIDAGIDWMDDYLRTCWAYWRHFPGALRIRYEDFLTDFPEESSKILGHLHLDAQSEAVQTILEKYKPGATPQVGTHFYKGEIGRFLQEFTPAQLQLCKQRYEAALAEMGYALE